MCVCETFVEKTLKELFDVKEIILFKNKQVQLFSRYSKITKCSEMVSIMLVDVRLFPHWFSLKSK